MRIIPLFFVVISAFSYFLVIDVADAFKLEGSCWTIEIEGSETSLICLGKVTFGDNLEEIAQTFQMSVNDLKELNEKYSDLLKPGDLLNVRVKTVFYPETYSKEEVYDIMDHFVMIYALFAGLLIIIPIIYLFVFNLKRKKDLDCIKDKLGTIEEYAPQLISVLGEVDRKSSGQSKDLSKLIATILHILRYDKRKGDGAKKKKEGTTQKILLLTHKKQ